MRKKRKKKRSAVAVFFRGFVKSLLLIGALVLVGFASYKVSLFYFNERGVSTNSKASKMIQELYGNVAVEDISKNLIYNVDKKSGKVKGLLLEIFNTNTSNMDYITIPVNTEITISNELYQKLAKAGCEAPQIIKISAIHKYFSEDTMYEYGELIINDFLGIDISYYTAVEPKAFEKMFKKTKYQEAVPGAEDAKKQTVKVWTLTEDYRAELAALGTDVKLIEEHIDKAYKHCTSNLPARSKKKYIEDYLKWNADNTYFHIIPGLVEEDCYAPLPEEARTLLEQILGNEAYVGAQERTPESTNESVADSKEYAIQILNGSQVNGLAAKYKTKLEAEGYHVASIGNYKGQAQTESSILVKEEEMGADLLLYIEGGSLSVSEALPEGIDIQIILGSDANQ